jgi:hypothetical protein
MPNPNYVLVRLDDPVGPDDAQKLAMHIVSELAFSDVAAAMPAQYVGGYGFVPCGEEVSSPPPVAERAPNSHPRATRKRR